MHLSARSVIDRRGGGCLLDFLEQIQSIKEQAIKTFNEATTSQALYENKVKYLGRQGQIAHLMKQLKNVSLEDRPRLGQTINQVKKDLEQFYEKCLEEQQAREVDQQIEDSHLDMTAPGHPQALGSEHPLGLVTDEIIDIFNRLGYSVQNGPIIETDEHCFTALNIPPEHPARDMQDTFYINQQYALRPHTSSIQIRTLRQQSLPLFILGPGSVFRRDNDISHSPMFHQIEGLVIDRKVSMAHLKGTLEFFANEFFANVKVRLRPSFFPFTEPSAEVDCSCVLCGGKGCRMCGQTGWVEIAGCGLVHPNVLKISGHDPQQWQGFAFGMGIERMAILKYKIKDIRLFFENDLRFLDPFY